jgi:hypothetical protein
MHDMDVAPRPADSDGGYWNGGPKTENPFLLSMTTFLASQSIEVLNGLTVKHEDIRALPFLYEVPKTGERISKSLISEERTVERWKKVATVYVVMSSFFQVGVALSLTLPHGHIKFSKAVQKLREFSPTPL